MLAVLDRGDVPCVAVDDAEPTVVSARDHAVADARTRDGRPRADQRRSPELAERVSCALVEVGDVAAAVRDHDGPLTAFVSLQPVTDEPLTARHRRSARRRCVRARVRLANRSTSPRRRAESASRSQPRADGEPLGAPLRRADRRGRRTARQPGSRAAAGRRRRARASRSPPRPPARASPGPECRPCRPRRRSALTGAAADAAVERVREAGDRRRIDTGLVAELARRPRGEGAAEDRDAAAPPRLASGVERERLAGSGGRPDRPRSPDRLASAPPRGRAVRRSVTSGSRSRHRAPARPPTPAATRAWRSARSSAPRSTASNSRVVNRRSPPTAFSCTIESRARKASACASTCGTVAPSRAASANACSTSLRVNVDR